MRTSLDAGAGAFLLNDANVSRDLSKWKFIGNHLEPDNSLILANVSSQDNNLESGVKSIIRQETHISAAQLDNLVDCIGLHKKQQIGIQKAIGFTTFHLMNQVTLGFLPPVAVQYSPLHTSFPC